MIGVSMRFVFKTIRNKERNSGSALILTVVLTSLLAIIGTVFLMSSRIDKMSSSAVTQDKQLNYAVDTVVEKIKERLRADVPGIPGVEYEDYPGQRDPWLATLEPHKNGTNYYWGQISDVTGFFERTMTQTRNVVIPSGNLPETSVGDWADADGDGIADAKWVELEGVNTKKGEKIFAAVRVIDNSAMINLNTAYKFDPNDSSLKYWDGSSMTQVNLMGLALSKDDPNYSSAIDDDLLDIRQGTHTVEEYEKDVIWRYVDGAVYMDPNNPYTPFDISDELELRNRFLLNNENIDTRAEGWNMKLRSNTKRTPYTDPNLPDWYKRTALDISNDPNIKKYSRRHLATTYSMDRIVSPDGQKQLSIIVDSSMDEAAMNSFYNRVKELIPDTLSPARQDYLKRKLAQLTVNLADKKDTDFDPSKFDPNDLSETYYGLEPFPVISELAIYIDETNPNSDNAYAVELYNPTDEILDISNYSLGLIDNTGVEKDEITFSSDQIPAKGFYIISSDINVLPGSIPADDYVEDSRLQLHSGNYNPIGLGVWDSNNVEEIDVVLKRESSDVNVPDLYLDRVDVKHSWIEWLLDISHRNRARKFDPNTSKWWDTGSICSGPMTVDDSNNITDTLLAPNNATPLEIKFDLSQPERLISPVDLVRMWTIGPTDNLNMDANGINFSSGANFADANGVFDLSQYIGNWNPEDRTIGEKLYLANANFHKGFEELIRFNLRDPSIKDIFSYLTRFAPHRDGIDNNNNGSIDEQYLEWGVPGRININTAPAYVIGQLPWVSYDEVSKNIEPEVYLARAITAYRDKLNLSADLGPDYSGGRYNAISAKLPPYVDASEINEENGFKSVAELAFVLAGDRKWRIDKYGTDGEYFDRTYDITPDSVRDDFDERDYIVSRIANLATVRSDVFTAYILVQVGEDGPQKRALAIFDRSGVFYNLGTGQVENPVILRCLNMVPEAE